MKPELTEEEFINWWLKKYHNTDLNGVRKAHPKWTKSEKRKPKPKYFPYWLWYLFIKDINKYTRDFYKTYAVTQEQHDEWYEWAINRIAKYYRYSKKRAKRMFCWDYLNVAPSIKDK